MHKALLRHLLADSTLMQEMRGAGGSLEAAISGSGGGSLDVLLSGDAGSVSEAEDYTPQEAIVVVTGRPALLIQNGVWKEPELESMRKTLSASARQLKDAISKVGRIEILNYGYEYVGTGWLLEENVLITNSHVAQHFARQRGNRFVFRRWPKGDPYHTKVDFSREYQQSVDSVCVCDISDIVFLERHSDLHPDMALLKLKAGDDCPLPDPLELDSVEPAHMDDIALIGYPFEDTYNDSAAMKTIFEDIYGVKRLSPGTVRGTRDHGRILEHDCTSLSGSSGSPVFNLSRGKVCGIHYSGHYKVNNYAATSLWLKSRLAQIRPASVAISKRRPIPAPTIASLADRRGYQPDFLGKHELEVPLPRVAMELSDQILAVPSVSHGELKYTHFSIVMNGERRMPLFTASNMDLKRLCRFASQPDRWFSDPRIPADAPLGADQRQHHSLHRFPLVRLAGSHDTSFSTNCTLLHARHYPQQLIWQCLEEYVLNDAVTRKGQACVFTAPVLADDDRKYRSIQLPGEFWKIIVTVNTFTKRLSATGYIFSQKHYPACHKTRHPRFNTYQVSLAWIEEKTGLRFALRAYDPLAQPEKSPPRVININRKGDIVL